MIFTTVNGIRSLVSYDFNLGEYIDVFSKNNVHESYWIERAAQQADSGILSQAFSIVNCNLVQNSSAQAMEKSQSKDKLSIG